MAIVKPTKRPAAIVLDEILYRVLYKVLDCCIDQFPPILGVYLVFEISQLFFISKAYNLLTMETPKWYSPVDEAVFESRTIIISGVVNSELAEKVSRQLIALDRIDPKKPIYLYINSPGGEITSGFGIYDLAKFIEPKIITVVTGLAASMGSLIALCADKKYRLAFPNSKFLIHQPLISGSMMGSASDLAIHARDIVKTKEKINQIYSRETGRPIEEIREAADRDNWMTADEALEFGLVTRIVKNRAELEAAAK